MTRSTDHRVLRRVIFGGLLLLWIGMVFGFSAQTADTSSHMSGGICRSIAAFLWEDFPSLPEARQEAIVESLQFLVRKTAHFLEYALGGALALGFFMTFSLSRKGQALAAMLFVAVNAAIDEGHQLFVDGRAMQITDVILDTLGGLCAVSVICLCFTLRERRRQRLDNSAVFDNNNKEE